jgi:hypothetical protein
MIRFKPNRGWQLKDAFTNTYNEFAEAEDQIINVQMAEFMESIKQLFIEKLRTDKSKDEETVLKPTIYYLQNTVSAAASRVNNKQEIEDYIELTFNNI